MSNRNAVRVVWALIGMWSLGLTVGIAVMGTTKNVGNRWENAVWMGASISALCLGVLVGLLVREE